MPDSSSRVANGYLIWDLMLAIGWIGFFIYNRPLRKKILWSSLISLPFGLGQLYFFPDYWSPQTLFDLGSRFHIDIESFALMFFLGGLAAVIYETIFKKRVPNSQHFCHPRCWCWFSLVVALASFMILLKLFPKWSIIWPSILGPLAGGIFAAIVYPRLRKHILFGGILFAGLYFVSLALMNLIFPSWIASTWNLPALSGILLIGVPLEEILFGFAFGTLWAPLYEEVCSRFL